MNELNVYHHELRHNEYDEFYLKYEADKMIEHHKYKRCLAMAKWCEIEEKRLEAIAPIFDTDKECLEYNSDYWNKWHNRWMELAEKFKPNKEAK